ncbi:MULTISPECIES: GntR family transcriptional regulator [unclassified Streptomyces]|uniref:GntR family transcriptional regulator n=1 Tax=unclassified Streptomyces TaxID=2593676 RepID=UPI002E2AA83E|nr:GntR family transcriptional regulator [Streptomyces sp. NBC_00223]
MAKAYERIADDLRQRIRAGELGPGDRLPSETALVDEYGKSLPTLRQALGLLQAEGLIEKQHGRGNFVRQPRTPVFRTNLRHQWEKNRAREPEQHRRKTGATEHDTGLDMGDLVFYAAYEQIEASQELAEIFDVPAGTAMVERTYRTRYRAESHPFSLVHSYLVRDMVAVNPDLLDAANEPWPGGTQNQLFTIGIELARIEEHVSARPPTAEESEELGLPPGTALIVLGKSSYDTTGRVVEHSFVRLPGDRTEMIFTTDLERW